MLGRRKKKLGRKPPLKKPAARIRTATLDDKHHARLSGYWAESTCRRKCHWEKTANLDEDTTLGRKCFPEIKPDHRPDLKMGQNCCVKRLQGVELDEYSRPGSIVRRLLHRAETTMSGRDCHSGLPETTLSLDKPLNK
eukprot:g25608.t1